MQEDDLTALRRPMRYVILHGDGFTSSYGPKDTPFTGYYSGDKGIIRRFVEAYLRQPEARIQTYPSFVTFVPVGVDEAQMYEEGGGFFYEADSDHPETRGNLFVDALNSMRDDLTRQFRHRIRSCRSQIVSIEMPLGTARRTPKDKTRFNELLDGIERLERPAFTFGEKGKPIWITATLRGGKREWFLLRPLRIESPRDVKTIKNPPLPPALWRWVNGF